jgi:ADP-ribosylglycohydrolase
MERPPSAAIGDALASRIRGMLLGLAIGDALGNTSEGMLPHERNKCYGEIRDYLPNRYAGGRPVALPSDDTQLAFSTLEHLLEYGRIEPDALAALFCSGRFSRLQSFVDLQASEFAATQVVPTAEHPHWMFRASLTF